MRDIFISPPFVFEWRRKNDRERPKLATPTISTHKRPFLFPHDWKLTRVSIYSSILVGQPGGLVSQKTISKKSYGFN
jgi:hypothetical protein